MIYLNRAIASFKNKGGGVRSKSESLLWKIKAYIEEYNSENGYSPTTREVAASMQIGNGTACRYMKELEKSGELARRRKGYEPISSSASKGMQLLPIFANGVPCGALQEVEGEVEGYLKLPESFTGKGTFFILKASGQSMVEAGIDDGDYLLIRKQNSAEVGDIIVALVENSVTLKRLKFDEARGKYYLHPENREMEDIYPIEIAVQGVATKVIKNLI